VVIYYSYSTFIIFETLYLLILLINYLDYLLQLQFELIDLYFQFILKLDASLIRTFGH
jgi:hypothetical protein